MTYSVWNEATKRYDYFEGPEPSLKREVGYRELGHAPDEVAWPLPSSVRSTGSGVHARGLVATRQSGSLGAFEGSGVSALWWIVGAAGFYWLMERSR